MHMINYTIKHPPCGVMVRMLADGGNPPGLLADGWPDGMKPTLGVALVVSVLRVRL